MAMMSSFFWGSSRSREPRATPPSTFPKTAVQMQLPDALIRRREHRSSAAGKVTDTNTLDLFGDLACGTGTLLSTAYQRIGQLHELAGGDSESDESNVPVPQARSPIRILLTLPAA